MRIHNCYVCETTPVTEFEYYGFSLNLHGAGEGGSFFWLCSAACYARWWDNPQRFALAHRHRCVSLPILAYSFKPQQPEECILREVPAPPLDRGGAAMHATAPRPSSANALWAAYRKLFPRRPVPIPQARYSSA